jgi:hypothetical protein
MRLSVWGTDRTLDSASAAHEVRVAPRSPGTEVRGGRCGGRSSLRAPTFATQRHVAPPRSPLRGRKRLSNAPATGTNPKVSDWSTPAQRMRGARRARGQPVIGDERQPLAKHFYVIA